MTQNISGTITIVAVALISLIFILYLVVLKKNGWLGRKSNFYRCPNQECKKIFQKPIELKDLSMNPPRTYPACPECGANLDPFFSSLTNKIPRIKPKSSGQNEIGIRSIETKIGARRASTNQHPKQQSMPREKTPIVFPRSYAKPPQVQRFKTSNQKQEQFLMLKQKVTVTNPEIKTIENKQEMKTAETSAHRQNLPSTPTEKNHISKTIKDTNKTNAGDEPKCEYYFGYLATINIKEDGAPLSCLECPKTLECMLSNYLKK